MKNMIKRFKNERGITLVELLAVVVILAIIGTIAFVLIGNVIENSKKDAHIANAQQLISAAKLYEAETGEEIGESGVSSDDELEDFIDPLVNPWTKETDGDYTGTVTKEDSEYKVELPSNDNGCDINNKEEEILKGREEVCP